ncbi:MAG: hypothetical protein ABH891_04455 [Candidatus Omnitrophota bacterium]
MWTRSFRLGVFLFLVLFSPGFSGFPYDPEYLNSVVGEKAVKFSDGFEMIMTLMQIEDQYPDFPSQREFLQKTKIIPPEWESRKPGDALRRGELAYMLVKMLRLKGGLKARLLRMNQRFAMEELIYEGIMRAGHGRDLVTGQELVFVMTATANFMADRHEGTSHAS